MEYSLSYDDIRKYLRNTKIIPYSDIPKYYCAKDLVGPSNECIILYKNGDNYGHWTCLLKNKHGYEFFDSYGIMLDDELSYPTEYSGADEEAFKKINNQDYRYLTNLLSQVKEPVSYNHHKFQTFKRADGIKPSTCGRHVIFRLLNKDKSLSKYKSEFDITRDLNCYEDYDQTVTNIIDDRSWY